MTTTRGTRLRVAAALLAAAGGLVAAVPGHAATSRTFSAPFALGPSGGDQFSYHSANPNGTVTVARAYPVPGVINCTKGGPFAKLLVRFTAARPPRRIVASYDSAAVDPFTFVQVGLRDAAHHWYGLTTVRGLVSGSGTVTLLPHSPAGRHPLVLEFGLEQSSACPNADEGTIHFSRIEVS